MIGLLLVLGMQARAQAPTVGDTVWVSRRVAVPARYGVRAAEWQLSGDVELLGPPRVTTADGRAEVAYPLVIWTPGSHALSVPGPLLLAPDGTVDSLPASDTTLAVKSVLPAGAPDTSLRPQPRAGLLHRRTVTWLPLIISVALASMILQSVRWWWRRRGPAPTPRAQSPAPAPPLEAWAKAGESRTVLGAAAARLRRAIAARLPDAHEGLDTPALLLRLEPHPEWPRQAIAELLTTLDDARFAVAPPADVLELHRRAVALAERLHGAGAGA